MAASTEDVDHGCVETNVDVVELLAETVRKYPVLYDKTLKEFKDRTMKNNAWKKVAECLQKIAEPIFTLLEYTGKKYEPKFYVTGPAPDYNKECWFKEKENLGLPLPNLPYYIDGEVKICQTNAILRYIARKHNLCGSTDQEKMRCDMIEQEVTDLRGGFMKVIYLAANFEEAKTQYVKNNETVILKRLANFLGANNYFAGNEVTFCDFMMYEHLDQLRTLEPAILNDFDTLKAFMARFEHLPRVREYLLSEKFMNKPIGNRMALWAAKPIPRVQPI